MSAEAGQAGFRSGGLARKGWRIALAAMGLMMVTGTALLAWMMMAAPAAPQCARAGEGLPRSVCNARAQAVAAVNQGPVARALGREKGSGEAISITVSSDAELRAALARAGSGSVIRLAPGDYGRFDIANAHYRQPLVIQAADPARPAQVDGFMVRNSSNVRISGLAVRIAATATGFPMAITNAERIEIEGLFVRGEGSDLLTLRTEGMMIRNSRDVSLSRSSFRNLRHGVSLLDSNQVTLSGNLFRGMRTDSIRGGGASDLSVHHNVFLDYTPAPKDHPDGIQIWSTNQKAVARNINIHDNLVLRGKGAPIQGIFIRDTFKKLPFENVRIANNLAVGTMYNGIAIAGVKGAVIEGNEVIAFADQKSWIRIDDGQDVKLSGNTAPSYLFQRTPVSQSGNRQGNASRRAIADKVRNWLSARTGADAIPEQHAAEIRASLGP